jgi:BirA family transcriptional regulator, biotin operon repressor / biotin---[acetyl-CoA-carboxylase] ligase
MTIGSKYIFHENLSSTNSFAAGLLKNKAATDGTIIHTNFQTSGRGQSGNSWESESGKNLLFSLVLFPTMISPADQFLISKAISLGICDYLLPYTDAVSIKWPNDIYVKNDKIAGILIESTILGNEIETLVAGIGLNINQKEFKSGAPNPVSLSMITGMYYDLKQSLIRLASCLDIRYEQLLNKGRKWIDDDYTRKLYRKGQWYNYRNADTIFEGRIISVTSDGRLQIETRNGEILDFGFKEVEFK